MKKLIVLFAVTVMALSVFAMSKPPAEAGACDSAKKGCEVKDAASCCTPDGSCKEKAGCEGDMKKAAEEKADCAGGTCPLTK